MKKLMIVVIVIVISTSILSADVYIKLKTKTGSIMGQPARELINEQWIGDDKMANITQEGTFIVDLAKKKFFMVNHQAKTYMESDLPVDISKMLPEQMAAMMEGMIKNMKVSVTSNGMNKKIGNWDCSGYDVNMQMMGMDIKMVVWASTDVPFDWEKTNRLSSEMMKVQLRLGDTFTKEFTKIKGYQISTEISMMGMDIKSEVVEIAQKKPGTGIYTVPEGYEKKDRMTIKDMQRR